MQDNLWRTNIKFYTDEKINPVYWNAEKQKAKEISKFPYYPEFNFRLGQIRVTIQNVFYKFRNTNNGKEPSAVLLKQLLQKEFNKTSQIVNDEKLLKTFWGFFKSFLQRIEIGSRLHLQKNTPLSQGTIKNLKNLGRHLKDYEWYKKHQLDFDSIDMKFYNDFTFFLTKKKQLSINTIGKLITNLKVVMREALEEGYTTNTIFTHRKFRSSSVETETVYLSENEIDEIRNLDLNNNKRLDKIRDLFIIGCYTGLRYSDLAKLSIDKIYDDILEVAQTKTGDRVHIPLREEVKQLIEKYNGNFPKTVSNQKFNEYLKEVCALCPSLLKKVTISKFTGGKKINATKPKFEFIKSHTARRSFATNEFLSHDLQTAEIRAITGHKSDKSFYKYIRVTPRENAENVAKKWAERKLRKIGSPNAGNLRAVS